MRIDDLRTTLSEHADVGHDAGLSDRAGAVRGRVRAVRRRRAAVAVACVAGAVLAVPAIRALEPTPPEPASERDLAGRTAPETMVSDGFTYEFSSGVDGSTDEPLDLRLDRSDEPRLVSWTVNAGRADGELTERRSGETFADTLVGGRGGFETFSRVPEGATASLRLTSTEDVPGAMALAVYTLSDERPAGVSGQGITYREEVAGSTLLDAAIGEPGQAEVSLEITVPPTRVGFSDVCTAPESSWVRLEVDGQQGFSSSSCAGESTLDPGGAGSVGFDLAGLRLADGSRLRVGERVEVTASIHPDNRSSSAPVAVPGAVVAIGAYALPVQEPIGVSDDGLDRLIERDGHTWSLADVVTSDAGDAALDYVVGPVRTATFVEVGAVNDGSDVTWDTSFDGTELARSYEGRAGAYGPGEQVVLNEGESLQVVQSRVTGADPSLQFYVAEYVRAD